MKKGGIDIRAFSKISKNSCFQRSCELYKERIQSDDEAREYAGLLNLNEFRSGDSKSLFDFENRVDSALRFIRNRRLNKALRKGKRKDGVRLVYEDEKCFIVSPDGWENSHKAAYLDNAKANWCIAIGSMTERLNNWNMYRTCAAYYVYLKGEDSWAITVDGLKTYILQNDVPCKGFPFDKFETRKNNVDKGGDRAREREFQRMLKRIGISRRKFIKLITDDLKKSKFSFDYEHITLLACMHGDYNLFKSVHKKVDLLKYRNRVSRQDYLQLAAEGGDMKICKFLMKAGLSLKTKSEDGNTALHWAANGGFLELVKYFLENGAEIDARNKYGDTPLGDAVMRKRPKVVRYLLKMGADMKNVDKGGLTLLHRAAFTGRKDIVDIFLKRGIDLNLETRDGMTALQYAVIGKYYRICEMLLKAGAKVNSSKRNSLVLAEELHWDEGARLLKEYGASVKVVDVSQKFGKENAKRRKTLQGFVFFP